MKTEYLKPKVVEIKNKNADTNYLRTETNFGTNIGKTEKVKYQMLLT